MAASSGPIRVIAFASAAETAAPSVAALGSDIDWSGEGDYTTYGSESESHDHNLFQDQRAAVGVSEFVNQILSQAKHHHHSQIPDAHK